MQGIRDDLGRPGRPRVEGVDVAHPDGEAKFWIDPDIQLAVVAGLSPRRVADAEAVVRRHEEEIRHAWTRHFGR